MINTQFSVEAEKCDVTEMQKGQVSQTSHTIRRWIQISSLPQLSALGQSGYVILACFTTCTCLVTITEDVLWHLLPALLSLAQLEHSTNADDHTQMVAVSTLNALGAVHFAFFLFHSAFPVTTTVSQLFLHISHYFKHCCWKRQPHPPHGTCTCPTAALRMLMPMQPFHTVTQEASWD